MALPTQKVQIPFGQGLAQEVAPALVQPGKLLTAEQVLIDKTGSMQERPGTDALTANIRHGATIAEGAHIFADGKETVITSPDRVYSYSEADSKWRDVDDGYEADIHRVYHGERNGESLAVATVMDVGCAGNWIVYAWLGNGAGTWNNQIYVRFVDYETGAHSRTFCWPANNVATDIRIVVVGGYIHVIWIDQTANTIVTGRFTAATMSLGPTFVTIGTLTHNTISKFDACTDGTNLLVVYLYDDGTPVTRVTKAAATGAPAANVNVSFIGAPLDSINVAYTISADATRVWVAYDTWNGVGRAIHAFVRLIADLSEVLAVTAVTTVGTVDSAPARISSVCDTANNRLWITWEETYTASTPREVWGRWLTVAGAASGYHHVYHVGLLSRPWIEDSKIYVFFYLSRGEATKGVDDVTSVYQRNAYLVEQMPDGSRWVGEA